ncbi:hypothetical protein GCM10009743_65260 [Kribbella swartbergensis]
MRTICIDADPVGLLEAFKIEQALADEEKPPDYNVAPTKTPAVVLVRPPRDDKDAEPVRQLPNLIWGLVPSWSKEAKLGRMINARAETVHENRRSGGRSNRVASWCRSPGSTNGSPPSSSAGRACR